MTAFIILAAITILAIGFALGMAVTIVLNLPTKTFGNE